MDFKTGKTVEIVKEFLANGGDKFEINGVDLSKAVFMYRERNSSFIPIPRGNYSTNVENNNLYINITGDVITKAYEYQVIYTSDMKAGKYLGEYPELKVLVSKYNDLVEDVTNIIKYTKSTGVKVDTLKMTQILTQLEPNTFWVMNTDEKLEAFPIGNLNSKYQEMVNTLKKEVEELIKTVKEEALSDVNNSTTSKLNDFQSELSKKLTELETLTDSLKSNLSSAVAKYIADNRDKLKGDRGAGITSITATGDEVTVNYDDSKSTVFTVPTVAGRDGQGIKDLAYTNNRLKITMSDNSSKEVEIKSGIKLRQVFEGEMSNNMKLELSDKWIMCFCVFRGIFGSNYKTENIIVLKIDEDQNLQTSQGSDALFVEIKNNGLMFSISEAPYKLKKVYVLEEVKIDKSNPGKISQV
nr:MAG TPA: hypothetical protein [Caudoviricetes sp.]